MTKKATPLSDVQEEQEAILAFVRLRIRILVAEYRPCCTAEIRAVEEFIKFRIDLSQRQVRRIRKKPKKVKEDFDAIGLP